MLVMALREELREFPVGSAFLDLTQEAADASSQVTDKFFGEAGRSLPETIAGSGTVLSILYRLACCYFGCRGGDHQVEWLAGKFVNQAVSAYRLVRAAQYDEALMLVRGMGELVNLLWLFFQDRAELTAWKGADKKVRMSRFKPSGVRARLQVLSELGPPVDADRYSALCEIGTHPVPNFAPGRYSGTGKPVLGAILQEVGVFVCINELAYTISMAAVPIAALLESDMDLREELKSHSVNLLRSMGNFTVLNYEESLQEILRQHTQES